VLLLYSIYMQFLLYPVSHKMKKVAVPVWKLDMKKHPETFVQYTVQLDFYICDVLHSSINIPR
jgi:hypothetical protein